MSSKPDIKFCLKWETQRPYVGKPQRSSIFSVFGEEFYLQIFLKNHNTECYNCYVLLCRQNGEEPLKVDISASCHVIAQDLAFHDLVPRRHTIRIPGDVIFQCYPSIDPLGSIEFTKNWIVYCNLSCVKFVSLKISVETIYLSTVEERDVASSTVDKSVQASPEIPADIEALSTDMFNLFLDQILPDFELRCNGHTFYVHKCILAARSEVFRGMLETKMQESNTGFANIEDLEVPVLESMLKIIYSGKIGVLSEDTAASLYEAADRYNVHTLFAACSQFMQRNLTEDNCIFSLMSADSHSDSDLKDAAVSFILAHPGVFKSAAWIEFSDARPTLAKNVLQAFVVPIVE